MISLDDKKIMMSGIKVNLKMTVASAELSGMGSSTASADAGFKPKTFAVTGQIPHDKPEHLQQVFALAEKTDDTGRHVYTIVNHTAQALKVRQVKFSGDVTAKDNKTLNAWDVGFSLTEHRSIAEKKEEQQTPQEAPATQAPGQAVAPSQAAPDDDLKPKTDTEKWLAKWDEKLADDEGESDEA